MAVQQELDLNSLRKKNYLIKKKLKPNRIWTEIKTNGKMEHTWKCKLTKHLLSLIHVMQTSTESLFWAFPAKLSVAYNYWNVEHNQFEQLRT